MEADFAPHMLYVTNQDKPGFIGRFGATLAGAGINIATFHLGRAGPRRRCDLPGLGGRGGAGGSAVRWCATLPLVVQATPLAF